MSNKEKLIEILTQRYKRYDGIYRKNAFNTEVRYQYYSFEEIKMLDNEDIDKVIQRYQSKTNEPMSMNNRLLLLNCVYETIADNKRYKELLDKLMDIYKIELDDKLTKPITRHDDFNFVETSELQQAPYTTMPEYSLVLANMCVRYLYESQKSYTEDSILPSTKVESRISIYEEIKSDFAKVNQQMPEIQEQIVSQAKVMFNRANEERNANIAKEQQAKEIELINLQQEINKMENERLEIEKRIKTISNETLGSYFSKQVSQRYPEEYQKFQEHRDQVRNYSSNATTISDLKARFTKVSEDLQFYKRVLPVYENYYQRFEEMKKKYHQQRTTSEQEQQAINNAGTTFKETPNQNQQQINDFDKNLIRFIEEKNSNFGKVSEILSVTGYPDSIYEVKFENGITHQITITQDERNFIKSHPSGQLVAEHSQQQVTQEEFNNVQEQEKQIKDKIVDQIMNAMNNAGEFSFGDISMGERMSIMQNVQNQLNAKSLDELQMLLSTYQVQNVQEDILSNGMHR